MSRRVLAYGLLLAGGALALLAGTQPWWRVAGEGVVVKITGTEATGGLSQALVIVVLAGTLLFLALRGRGRRLVGALLLTVGLGMAVAGGLRRQPNPAVVRSQVPHAGLVDALDLSATVWPWVYAISGVLITAGAAVTMITAGNWPSRSDRFRSRSSQAESDIPEDPAELWKAMDAGVDPTATAASVGNRAPPHGGEGSGGVLPPGATTAADSERDARAAAKRDQKLDGNNTPTVADPRVRDQKAGDTMDGTEQARQLLWSPTSQMSGEEQRGPGERET
jgi:uncharacterized membrane protein (TIGR02234 family)